MSIGSKILALMEQQQVSANRLAMLIGEEVNVVNEIITNEEYKCDFFLLNKISTVFNVGLEYFLENHSDDYLDKKNGGAIGNFNSMNLYSNDKIIEHILKRLEALEKKIK